MLSNRLFESTSPYLLQHKDNPVHWQMWGPEAFALAQAENKPVLLSIGYAACHWCHVMAHESFEDPQTAAVMNELFVNIKLDREERPDIDAVYMNALQLLGIPGGWPMTMFLSPKGEPFWGGTYFPPTPRYGQPSFGDVLQAVHRTFLEKPQSVAQNSSALRDALSAMAEGAAPVEVSTEWPLAAAIQIVSHIDPAHGGLRGAPKFPHAPLLELLWRAFLKTGDEALAQAVTLSLDHMCQGGMYDHLGGGFARYSVDERWLAPHFEKMLYDNASLVELLSVVWLETRRPLYAARVTETIEFVLRELRAPDGGFAASLDADSEGEEGRFYVWSAAEIVAVLGREALSFNAIYDVTEEGNWEGHTILNRLSSLELLAPETEHALARKRAALFEHRSHRVRPGFDDKLLADWNGLMIAALVKAGTAFDKPEWSAEADAGFVSVMRLLSFERDGLLRLRQSYRANKAQHEAVADAYANLARAALLLEEATGRQDRGAIATRLVESLDRMFWDEARGGYFYSAADAEGLLVRGRSAYDHPLPSANGVMIEVLTRLYHRSGEARFQERVDRIVTAFSGEAEKAIISHAAYLNGFDFATSALQIVILGAQDEEDTRKLLNATFSVSDPAKSIAVIPPGTTLPAYHPASGKIMLAGQATAYVCRGTRCSLPLHDPAELAKVARAFS